MIFRKTTRQEFINAITDDKADAFAKTFVAKADMQDQWEHCVGAWKDNELAGAVIVTVSKREPKIANLQLLHTFSKFRKQGVGKSLCERSFHSIINSAEYFRVSSEPESVEFYKRLGFKFQGKQKSGCQLSIFRINGDKFSDGIYEMYDTVIRNAVYRKGKGGCVEIF